MNKKIILSLFYILVLLSSINLSSALFSQNHIASTIKGFDQVDSEITRMCRPYLKQVVDFNTGTDIPVIHYYDSKVSSYIGTHTRGAGYQSCLNEAGTDVEKRCGCIAVAMHFSAIDRFAHLTGGLVPTYLKNNYVPNFIAHMVIERSYEERSMKILQATDPEFYTKVQFYNKDLLSSFFTETGGDDSNLKLLNIVAGIDLTNDAKLFREAYIGGSFYSTVYKDKIRLPAFVYYISFILIGLGLSIGLFLIFKGNTKWRFFASYLWFLVAILGLVIFISFLNASTWKLTTALIELPPKLGFLQVSDKDIAFYDGQIQQAVNDLLRTGVVSVDDGSGLSYVDRNGNQVTGALNVASIGFFYVTLPIILFIFLLTNLWLVYRSFVISNKIKFRRIGIFLTGFAYLIASLMTIITARLTYALFF